MPSVGQSGQKGQSNPVTGCQLGSFDRTVEDNQLLSEHGILNQEIGPKKGQVSRFWRAIPDIFGFLDCDRMRDLTAFWGKTYKTHA